MCIPSILIIDVLGLSASRGPPVLAQNSVYSKTGVHARYFFMDYSCRIRIRIADIETKMFNTQKRQLPLPPIMDQFFKTVNIPVISDPLDYIP